MSREYVDRGPYLCRYEACHGWVVYLNDAGDLKHLCSTNAEAKAKDIVGIMNADVARFDAKMRTPAPATAVEEARGAVSSLVEKRRSFLEASMAVMKDARSGGGNNLYINTVNDGLLDAQDKAYDELIAEMKRMGMPTP